MQRREFLRLTLATLASASCTKAALPPFNLPAAGSLVGSGPSRGHLIRKPLPFQQQKPSFKTTIAIVGGGIAGLSAAWKLIRSGIDDFIILELEDLIGGNSRYQEYQVSKAPWAAHYLPVPTKEAKAVQELLYEMGLLTGYDAAGRPLYDHRHLCHYPQERVFYQGKWEEGLIPLSLATPKDLEQLKAFTRHIEKWKTWHDKRGRRAFAIPLDLSSPEAELRHLDSITIKDYLLQHGWDSELLHHYIDYACRDDYGCDYKEVSAWAGLHYFASRDGGGYTDTDAPLVWPEGNGRLAQYMADLAGDRIQTSSVVLKIEATGAQYNIHYLNIATGEHLTTTASYIIYALPTFTRRFILGDFAPFRFSNFSYAPWVTANLVLNSPPRSLVNSGFPLAWDNVIYDSPSLGYVVADHQNRSHLGGPMVITWYYPLTGDPHQRRTELLNSDWNYWSQKIITDLEVPHPGIHKQILRLDVMRLGHAMIRPTVGFIWSDQRAQASRPYERIYFAHSDLCGISIFEHAQYSGVKAAQDLMQSMAHPFQDSLH